MKVVKLLAVFAIRGVNVVSPFAQTVQDEIDESGDGDAHSKSFNKKMARPVVSHGQDGAADAEDAFGRGDANRFDEASPG